MPSSLSYSDYTVGWISAVPIEMAAAGAMLDEVHPDLPTPANDDNAYILGQIADHNIVIACLPSGEYGISSAATVATQLVSTFSAVRFGLMVGIGGGIWSENADVRLGDIVVSHPSKTHGGVIQYDYGKALTGGHFERTGMLNRPPQILLTAISKLRAYYVTEGSRVSEWVADAAARSRVIPSMLPRPNLADRLYEADYPHNPNQATCETCDQDRVVDRSPRANTDPSIHYGLILSGDQVIKDSRVRDRLAKEEAYCVEMEAAGLMNHFPCLVIRGICDYADSHKNKEWQGYAAAAAAAYAKELLQFVPLCESAVTQSANDAISGLDQRASEYIDKLPRAGNAAYNSILGEKRPFCLPNTRVQILETISSWCTDDTAPSIFWLSGMAGTGKSTIARTVADNFAKQGHVAVSFFFSRGGGDLASSSKLVPTLAAQFANRDPS